jgi:hypothetical protein
MNVIRDCCARLGSGRLGLCLLGASLSGLAFAGGRVAIVDEAALAERWTPAPGQPHLVPGYPSNAADKSADVCVTIGYQVGSDGSTSDFSELKSWTSAHPDGLMAANEAEPFTQIAAAVVARRKFVPVGKPHAVFTSATFAFDGSQPLGEEAIRAHCQIEDLHSFVAQLQARARAQGDLESEALKRRLDVEQGRR